jgi:homoserine O-acetyltransferase
LNCERLKKTAKKGFFAQFSWAFFLFDMNKETKNIKKLIIDQSLELDCGKTIKDFPLAYETYGTLNKSKTNAILVFHALSGDQFVTNINPITKKKGWWTTAVGPGKAIDTDKFFVICVNVLGGCMGSFGPKEINPETNELFATTFPVITIKDMVKAQIYLLEHLGINKLLSVTGGSMGGMQVLQFASLYPDKTYSAIPIACSASHSAQNIALNELGRQAIMADPNWNKGNYFKTNLSPDKGLAVARMAAHITYLSDKGLQEKFGRKLQVKGNLKFSFDADFQIESYLRHQGSVFVDRFDANSYLYITRAMDYFDLTKQFNGNLANAFKKTKTKFCVISFSSDWLYPTKENKEIVIALNASGVNVSFVEINSDKGHDSFLLDIPEFLKTLGEFINSNYKEFNNETRI